MKFKNIICISGRICAGKSQAAECISRKFGFPVISFGEFLHYYSIKNKYSIERQTFSELGDKLVSQDPQHFLNEVIEYFPIDKDSIILDGVRHKAILDAITEITENRIAIFINTSFKTRYQRCYSRKKIYDDFSTFEKFYKADSHRVEAEIESLKLYCDIIVDTRKINNEKLLNLISTYLIGKKERNLGIE